MHAQVDLFDRLPTPFGLVRGGVAPDHPKIKSVIRVYEKTAAREGFRFFGNVKVGHDIEVEDLERLYHAIVFTVGCETDRQLGIPGEHLPGSHAATAFVGWYNAHPDYAGGGVRPLLRAGGGDRQRQRGDGRRPDAGADRPRAAPDRHCRPLDRDARRQQDPGDRRARPPRAGPGRLHQPGDQGAGRDGGRRRRRRPVRDRAGPGQPGLPGLRGGRQDDPGQRRDPAGVLPARTRGQAQADRPALPRLPGRDRRTTAGSRGS